ncbi:POU domain, class 4, transcription factor 3 [Anolis carolinensis]|uniref:POU domain, class 4, transcription factor 3 n=1 Tax=Anolis carolinensis TaxID=28377 RepID=UPI002F2B4A42
MLGMNPKHPFGLPLPEAPKFPPGLHACLSAPQDVFPTDPPPRFSPLQLQGHIFGGFEESLLVAADLLSSSSSSSSSQTKSQQHPFQAMSSGGGGGGHPHHPLQHPHPHPPHPPPHQGLEGDLLEHFPPSALMGGPDPSLHPHLGHLMAQAPPHPHPPPPPPPCLGDVDSDPRELEAFAERFKQRRIKLGVTQADVGAALAELKLPGVGSLSQSTICRFESLTLSHNNMVALQPVLRAWLDEAEAEAAQRLRSSAKAGGGELLFGGGGGQAGGGAERKRKRTSIAAPEKRSLEAYFALQPRPSSEKIAAIAEKLELKKNVVRVWFCNQRQKQKRMKYAAAH